MKIHIDYTTHITITGPWKMNKWEIGFIESIDKQLEGGKPLNYEQLKRLKRIWYMVFG